MAITTAEAESMDLGSLGPIRRLLQELDEVEEKGGSLRPEGDGAAHAVNEIRRRLREAIEEAEDLEVALDVHQLAALEGVSVWAIYKRRERGQLEAEKRNGRLRFRVVGER